MGTLNDQTIEKRDTTKMLATIMFQLMSANYLKTKISKNLLRISLRK